MKKLTLLGLALLASSTIYVNAGSITTGQDAQTPFRITATVYNDSGSNLTSGTVVIWDNDDTEFDNTAHPYVTTTTSGDSPWVAGVMLTNVCNAGQLCEIVIRGATITLCAGTSDACVEDTLVSTSSVAGSAGDYAPGDNTCSLGMAMASATGSNTDDVMVNVQPTCR